MSRQQLAVAIGKSPQTFEKYEAEPPADLLEVLRNYALSIGRPDAIRYLAIGEIPPSGEASAPIGAVTEYPPSVTSEIKGPNREEIQVTPEEWRFVSRVLHIVRGGRAEALSPLDTNLDAFVVLTDLLQGGTSGTAPVVPATTPDLQREMDAVREAEEEIRRIVAEVERSVAEARGTAQDPRRTRKDLRSPKAGNS